MLNLHGMSQEKRRVDSALRTHCFCRDCILDLVRHSVLRDPTCPLYRRDFDVDKFATLVGEVETKPKLAWTTAAPTSTRIESQVAPAQTSEERSSISENCYLCCNDFVDS